MCRDMRDTRGSRAESAGAGDAMQPPQQWSGAVALEEISCSILSVGSRAKHITQSTSHQELLHPATR